MFDKINGDYQRENNGIKKLISVHGNRLLLHMIFEELKNSYDFVKEYVDIDEYVLKALVEKYIGLFDKAKKVYIQMHILRIYLKMLEDARNSKNL